MATPPITSPDSSVAGILRPVSGIFRAQDLAHLLQQFVAAVSGLDPTLVRPRWEPEPAVKPAWTSDWCAVGIVADRLQPFPSVIHDGTDDGSDVVVRQREFELLCSFYGPNGDSYALTFLQGLTLEQNRAMLLDHQVNVVAAGSPVPAPELVRGRWLYRIDVEVTFRQALTSIFNVKNLLDTSVDIIISAEVDVAIDSVVGTRVVFPNPPAMGGGNWYLPTGIKNGVNTVFDMGVTPPAGNAFLVILNGLIQSPATYSSVGSVLTMNDPPQPGDELLVWVML